MANQYSAEVREAALRRLLPPKNESYSAVSREMNISVPTLMAWKKTAASGSSLADIKDDDSPLSSKEKHEIVVATAGLNEIELGEYARAKGLYVEQINNWRKIAEDAFDNFNEVRKQLNAVIKGKDDHIQDIEKDLERKNKALAELTAEVLLRKKCLAIWGEEKAN